MRTTPRTSSGGTAGTTWRSTRSTAWSCRWSRGSDAKSVQELVTDVKERLDGRVPELITTDEYSAYEGAILEAFGTEVYRRDRQAGAAAEGVQGGTGGAALCHGAQLRRRAEWWMW